MLLNNVYRLLSMRKGEGKSSLLFSLFAFCWALGVSCGSTLSEGIFLETLGADQLPLSYIVSGVVMCTLSITLLWITHRFSSASIFALFFVFTCLSYASFILFVPTTTFSSATFSFLYKTFSDTLFMAFTLCFWNYIDQFYDMQDAKRVYCLFNSAILLGTAIGGIIISEGFTTLGIRGLYILILASLLTSALLFIKAQKKFKPLPSEEIDQDMQAGCIQTIRHFLKNISKSPFSIAFVLSFLISQVLLILTTYGYMDAFEAHFASTNSPEGSLTSFLGSCTFWVAISNMLFGLIFYSRLIRFAGVNNVILITPLIMMGLYFSWSISTLFIFAIIGLFTVEGIWFSIDENTCNLLVNAVPGKIKRQVRAVIESFFEPVGMMLCGLMLVLMQGVASPRFSYYIGFALSILFVLLTLFIRKKYKSALISNLSASAIDFKKRTDEWLDELSPKDRQNAYFHFLCLLRAQDDRAQIFAFKALLHFKDPRLLPHLVNHLDRYSIRVRLQAIEALEASEFSSHRKVIELMNLWLKAHRHPGLVKIAFAYLSKQRKLPFKEALTALMSSSLTIRSSGILALMQLKGAPAIAKDALNELLDSSKPCELSKGIEILGFLSDEASLSLLIKHLTHSSLKVKRAAVTSIARRACPSLSSYSTMLISHLSSSEDIFIRERLLLSVIKIANFSDIEELICSKKYFLPKERRMLEEYIKSFGTKAAPKLLKVIKNASRLYAHRIRAAKILSLIDLTLLKEAVSEEIDNEIQKAYFFKYHATTNRFCLISLPYLPDILKSRYFSLMDFIIQILAITAQVPSTELLSRSVRSHNQKIQSNALETIEKITPSKIFRKLLPLIDHDTSLKGLEVPPLGFDTLLEIFSSSELESDRMIASKLQKDQEVHIETTLSEAAV